MEPIAAVRLVYLKGILDLVFHGNQSELARAIGRKSTFVNELLQGKRSFGEKLARSIEEKLGMNPMDLDGHRPIQNLVELPQRTNTYADWPFEIERERFEALSPSARLRVDGAITSMILEFERDSVSKQQKKKSTKA